MFNTITKTIQNIGNKLMASINTKEGSTITINGKTYSGKNISVINNEVYIDGELQTEASFDKIINITINGDVSDVHSISGDIHIEGNVGNGVVSTSGDIEIKGVVGGSVSTVSGDISATDIQGSVSTISGNVYH